MKIFKFFQICIYKSGGFLSDLSHYIFNKKNPNKSIQIHYKIKFISKYIRLRGAAGDQHLQRRC